MDADFLNLLKQRKESFDVFFTKSVIPEIQNAFHPKLAEACIYSLNAGGKRIRPILVLSAFESRLVNPTPSAFFLASAIECIHTYSLIHDDLPSMDNDDYRRGVLTCHKKFSESTAILAGDALNAFGFFLLSKIKDQDNDFHSDALKILHDGAGGPGMVSGQIEDLENEAHPHQTDISILERIHRRKTGALIVASLLLGNRLHSDHKAYENLFQEYGEKIGLLFQITDDIIDTEGSFADLGKTPGKDEAKGKLTYPSFYGLMETKKIRDVLEQELKNLGNHLESKPFFSYLPEYIAKRKA